MKKYFVLVCIVLLAVTTFIACSKTNHSDSVTKSVGATENIQTSNETATETTKIKESSKKATTNQTTKKKIVSSTQKPVAQTNNNSASTNSNKKPSSSRNNSSKPSGNGGYSNSNSGGNNSSSSGNASQSHKPVYCDEGGTQHSRSVGLGWYSSYNAAKQAGMAHIGNGSGSWEVQQCEYCGKYTVYVKID